MTDDRRNFFVFVAIAALILFGWPLAQQKFFPTANPPATKVVDAKSTPLPNPAADPTADGPAATRDRAKVLAETPRVRIATPRLAGSINLKGARIDDLVLVDYKETIAKDSAPIRLLSPAGSPEAYFAGFGWQGQGLAPPGPDTVWKASGPELSPGHPVTLDAANAAGLRFRIELSVDASYMFTVRQTVLNAGAAPVGVAAYGLVNRTGVSKDAATWQSHTGPMSVHGGSADYSVKFKDVDGAAQHWSSTGGWLGFDDKYWLTALVPDQGRGFDGQFRAGARESYQADATSTPMTLAPGKAITQTSRFFAGAKEVKTLEGYEAAGVPLFHKAIDWGWFEIVERPIFHYLDWLFKLVGNFGVAIVLLTLTIRGLLFPIAQRQFASMAQMRAIQPKMKALQERYKDDKAKQQQEVMALYKTEKVNPLAGCLPTLLQIPIFYALYKVLMLSIEMRHQPFALWIKDLSAPDPLTPINLFGLLPFDPPGFLHLGVLAILLGITMYVQFKLSPQPGQDAATQQVMGLMPWVMMFFFAPFAAGLQLYYVASNCLTILQQRWLYSAPSGAQGGADTVSADRVEKEELEAARKLFAGPIAFLKSAPALEHLPDPVVPEVAFAGRSNVGKSSLLNALTGRNALARTSNTPGRTQELNFFDVGTPLRFRLVDMPGYGFAKAPPDMVRRWRYLVNDYLRGRQALKRTLLLIDSRHGIKDVDREIMAMLDKAAVGYRLVLTKADKIKATDLAAVAAATADEARKRPAAHPEVIATSSEGGLGIAELRAVVVEAAAS